MGEAFPTTLAPAVVFGGAAWTLSVVFFVVQGIAQAASVRPFSLTTNLISDLGNTTCSAALCSPLHDLMNGTFIVVGVLHWSGAAATWRAWPGGIRSRAGLSLLALAGWGLIFAGTFPEDVAPDMHRFGALVGLVSLNVSMMLLGSVLLERVRPLGLGATVAGVVGLISLAMFLIKAPGLPSGVWERLADYPGAAMVVVMGAFIVVRAFNDRVR